MRSFGGRAAWISALGGRNGTGAPYPNLLLSDLVMATYCIGDLHGCYNEFMKLLEQIKFDPAQDELYLTGDLIGRGPLPLETMRAVLQLGNRAHSVLGNHDVNFLAVAEGISIARPKDNLEPLLNSSLLPEIVDYFISTPFLLQHPKKQLIMVHAGIYPLWELTTTKKMAKELGKVMHDPVRRRVLLTNMYSDEPNIYTPELAGLPRWRFALTAFTRMRLCYRSGVLDFKNTAISPELVEKDGLYPWFSLGNVSRSKKKQYTLVFGHWAALNGLCRRPYFKALDTGCVWGDKLTCWCFDTDKISQVKSTGYIQVKAQVSKL